MTLPNGQVGCSRTGAGLVVPEGVTRTVYKTHPQLIARLPPYRAG